jgi:superfamily II DNA helicase RecQ
MQIKIFTIPITDNGIVQEEMNKFLRGHKVLEVTQEFYQSQSGAAWCFSVKYIETPASYAQNTRKAKIDYRDELDEATFNIFAKLRQNRKTIAEENGIPAYAVFTDAELAEIAKLSEITAAKIKTN